MYHQYRRWIMSDGIVENRQKPWPNCLNKILETTNEFGTRTTVSVLKRYTWLTFQLR